MLYSLFQDTQHLYIRSTKLQLYSSVEIILSMDCSSDGKMLVTSSKVCITNMYNFHSPRFVLCVCCVCVCVCVCARARVRAYVRDMYVIVCVV